MGNRGNTSKYINRHDIQNKQIDSDILSVYNIFQIL